LEPGKECTLPSSFIPISVLDTIGKLFEKILLCGVLKELNDSGLICGDQQPTLLG
jgi:hypothetical protein